MREPTIDNIALLIVATTFGVVLSGSALGMITLELHHFIDLAVERRLQEYLSGQSISRYGPGVLGFPLSVVTLALIFWGPVLIIDFVAKRIGLSGLIVADGFVDLADRRVEAVVWISRTVSLAATIAAIILWSAIRGIGPIASFSFWI